MCKIANSKFFWGLLLFTVIGEFLVPFVLSKFYDSYNSKLQVMSVLGSSQSPVRIFYNAWLIWLGIFLSMTAIVFWYNGKSISNVLAIVSMVLILIFAIGAGILAGLFSVNETKEMLTISSKIHGFAAAIGFMALLFFPLINSLIEFKNDNSIAGIVGILSFVFAFAFFVLFIMGDKPEFKNTIVVYEGIWERLTLAAMYVPFVYQSIKHLLK